MIDRKPSPRWTAPNCLAVCALVLRVETLSAGDDVRGLPDAAEIITKALAWADWQQEQPYIKTLTGCMRTSRRSWKARRVEVTG